MFKVGEKLTRIVQIYTSHMSSDSVSDYECWFEAWIVDKVTPKGAWVTNLKRRRWVSNKTNFAHRTTREARESFHIRQKIRLQHLHRQTADVDRMLRIIDKDHHKSCGYPLCDICGEKI